MSALLLSILTVVAPGEGNSNAPSPELRKFYDISQDVRSVIREQARAESNTEKAAAIHHMTDLYMEIKRDPRLKTSDVLKSYKAKLWSRLTTTKKKLVREFDLPPRPAPRRGAPAAAPKTTPVDALAGEISDSLAEQLSVVGGTMGGPAQLYSPGDSDESGARGGGTRFDYGPDLVDLIERTIQPEFWDTNGGPGSIFYYKPLHALVVSATSEIHHSLGGTLDGLRDAMN